MVLTVTMAALMLGSAAVASHRARSAADLGALAGAVLAIRGGGASTVCARAGQVVATDGGKLIDCSVNRAAVTLRVKVRATWPGLGEAVARARAGPGTR